MPHRIVEQLRVLAVKCSRLASDCSDRKVATALEGVSVELADKAQKLQTLFDLIDRT